MDDEGTLYDPYGGQTRFRAPCFTACFLMLSEDPLRVLRVARFAARYKTRFTVAEETLALMQQLADSGELRH